VIRAARAMLLACTVSAALFAARDARAQMLPGASFDVRPDTSAATGALRGETDGLALEGPVDPAAYVLGPGDGLMLDVVGTVTMRVPLDVDPEGSIWIPDYGPMRVAGRTLAQARDDLRRLMKGGGSRGFQTHLRLVRLRRVLVYIEGEVRSPGAVRVTALTRLSEAVRLAGGLTARASQRNIRLIGVDSTRSADLLRFARTGDAGANPLLRDGDRVLVPIARAPLYLYAPVSYPGSYEFRPGETLADLITVAGGLLPTALPERGRVLRFRDERQADTLNVDMARAVTGGATLELAEGDRIFIPATTEYHEDRNVIVRGEILHPGNYPIDEGVTRVSDVLDRAGGLTGEASANGILVVRRRSSALERDLEFDRLSKLSRGEMTDGEYQVFRSKLAFAQTTFRVDVESARTSGSAGQAGAPVLARDVALVGGDVVVVERSQRSVQVAGEVRLPGLVAFDSTRTGVDYIKLAGGYSERASVGGVRLTRVSTGQTLLLRDAHRVEPGDLIYVPEKKDINWFGVLRDVVALAASIATVYVLAR